MERLLSPEETGYNEFMERREERIVTIYADVLVALNLYVTWFLLLASEALSGRSCRRWRRGVAAFIGGISSLAIFLPELPFGILAAVKLLLAAVITGVAGGKGGFFRQIGRASCRERVSLSV